MSVAGARTLRDRSWDVLEKALSPRLQSRESFVGLPALLTQRCSLRLQQITWRAAWEQRRKCPRRVGGLCTRATRRQPPVGRSCGVPRSVNLGGKHTFGSVLRMRCGEQEGQWRPPGREA